MIMGCSAPRVRERMSQLPLFDYKLAFYMSVVRGARSFCQRPRVSMGVVRTA